MIQEDLLIKVLDRINQLNIPYMMTGGIAAIFYGRPRLTHDFDIIIEMDAHHIAKLENSFKNDFYISPSAIQEAIDKRSMFNIIHYDSGIKVDFWLIEDDEYDRKRFERRRKHLYGERDIFFTSPEDVILIKLLWFKDSQIQKHRDDARGVLEIQQNLDMDYLGKWAKKLSVHNLLEYLLKEG